MVGETAIALRLGSGIESTVGVGIFKMRQLKSLADKDGVEWLGWTLEDKCPGVEKKDKWRFVAVEKVEKVVKVVSP